MTSMTQHPESRRDDQQSADEPARAHRRLVVGVDTHKYVHVAVALDEQLRSLQQAGVATTG